MKKGNQVPAELIELIGTKMGKNVITGIQVDSPGIYGVFGMESDDHTEEDVKNWKESSMSTTYAFRPGTRIGEIGIRKQK